MIQIFDIERELGLAAQIEQSNSIAYFSSLEQVNKEDKIYATIKELLELANRSKGDLWFGMTVVSAVSGFISFFAGLYHGK